MYQVSSPFHTIPSHTHNPHSTLFQPPILYRLSLVPLIRISYGWSVVLSRTRTVKKNIRPLVNAWISVPAPKVTHTPPLSSYIYLYIPLMYIYLCVSQYQLRRWHPCPPYPLIYPLPSLILTILLSLSHPCTHFLLTAAPRGITIPRMHPRWGRGQSRPPLTTSEWPSIQPWILYIIFQNILLL